MAKKNNKSILLIGLIGIIILAYYMGGVPFMGALVLFEEGNEIVFASAYTETTKEIDEATGLNITQDFAAVTEEERYLTLQSKYITDAYMRIYGTPGISNAKLDIAYDVVTPATAEGEEPTVTTVEEPIWTQPADFAEIEEIDLTTALSNHEEGDTITFKFHSDTPGSLIVATFNVDWGPTQAQVSACESTEGTFDESTFTCSCPSNSIGFTWDSGCEFAPEEEPSAPSAGTSSPSSPAPPPTTTTTLQATQPKYSLLKIIILVGILGLLIYYFGFEKGPGGFFKKI